MPNKKIIFEKSSVKDIHLQLTPFVYDAELEARFDKLLERRKSTIKKIRKLVENNRFSADNLVKVINEDPEEALNAIISVLGLSQEEFFRHITLLRFEKLATAEAIAIEAAKKTAPDVEATKTEASAARVAARNVEDEDVEAQTEGFTSEWKMERITKEISKNSGFATDVVKMLLGERRREMEERVPRFLLDKLDPKKIQLEPDALIDSLIRTGLKGRYDAQKGKPIVETAVKILKDLNVAYIDGEITIPGISRKMDIVVPGIDNPFVLVECGVFATTARELSEKGLVERVIRGEIEKKYPDAVIVRILDGIGWLARGGDALKDVMESSHYVLTGKTIAQFAEIIKQHVPSEYFR
jgi:hypothetical protein